MGQMTKVYLGDGVYASYDGYHVVLSTDGDVIYLDAEVLGALNGFVKQLFESEQGSDGLPGDDER